MKLSKALRKEFQKIGRMGGKARAKSMTPERRSEVAKSAANARWQKVREGVNS